MGGAVKKQTIMFNNYALYTMCGYCLIKVSDIDYENKTVVCEPINFNFINQAQFAPQAEEIVNDASLSIIRETMSPSKSRKKI